MARARTKSRSDAARAALASIASGANRARIGPRFTIEFGEAQMHEDGAQRHAGEDFDIEFGEAQMDDEEDEE